MLPTTTTRVARHTSAKVNRTIQKKIKANVAHYASANSDEIDKRLNELDREWDIERSLEANGSTLLLIGLALGTFLNRKWYFLPAFVGAFCLQHALQGWCPPIEAFRRLGVRTSKEIDEERVALKALRGDFQPLYRNGKKANRVQKVLKAARL